MFLCGKKIRCANPVLFASPHAKAPFLYVVCKAHSFVFIFKQKNSTQT